MRTLLDCVVVGAGPYGLTMGATLAHKGIDSRVYGKLMDTWANRMPKGMNLKLDGFSSNMRDPEGRYTLKRFCRDNALPYEDEGLAVTLDTYVRYGRDFQRKVVPQFEEKEVTRLEAAPHGFSVTLDNGEVVATRQVVLAVGISHFALIPPVLASLPKELCSHSSHHHEMDVFAGREVAIIGAGSSASDIAGLMHEAGARVTMVVRGDHVPFQNPPSTKPRSLLDRIRKPNFGLGPDFRSSMYVLFPHVFRRFPEPLRLRVVKRHLGPRGSWTMRDRVLGKVPILYHASLVKASHQNGRVMLEVAVNGAQQTLAVDHVIAATGYQTDVSRLSFIEPTLRQRIKTLKSAPSPELSSRFETSVPGLFMIGVASANCFGPLMRFSLGAKWSADRVLPKIKRQRATGSVIVGTATS